VRERGGGVLTAAEVEDSEDVPHSRRIASKLRLDNLLVLSEEFHQNMDTQ
jgi:hypothetical protein